MSYGLTTTGFENKDLDTILAEIEASEKTALGQSLNVRPTSVVGVLNGIIATKLSELWDVGNDVWGAFNPDTAVGASLDQLCQLTGVTRESAQQSTVVLSLSGTNGTVIPALRRVKHNATGTFWTNPVSGTIGASGVLMNFVSEDFGEIAAIAGTLTVIDTPVSGWTAVTNPLDAELGQVVETDAELRLRRQRLLTASGKATIDAIRAAMLKVDGIESATVLENTTMLTDANGLPAKSFEAVLDNVSAVANEIGQALWDVRPAGISAYGTTPVNAVDALGTPRVMAYTPATVKNVYVSVTAVTGVGFSGLTADFSDAYNAYEATLDISDDVSYNGIISRSFVAGVEDITGLAIGFSASPTGTSNLAIGIRERAKFDSSRTVVTLA